MPKLAADATDTSTVEVVGRLIIRSLDYSTTPATAKTHHSFSFPVTFPHSVISIIKPLFKRVCAEIVCDSRTAEEWVEQIKEATPDPLLRAWVSSLVFWDYLGDDPAPNPITEMAEPLPVDFQSSDKDLIKVLRRVGYPTPEDRVMGIPVARRKINRALARLGSPRIKIK